MRQTIRLKNYCHRTEKAYTSWVRRFILYHGKRHPVTMGTPEIESFLAHLATDLDVAASTQDQALRALHFLYREVLSNDVDLINAPVRAKRPKRLPTDLTKLEIEQLFNSLSRKQHLTLKLRYGGGLRLMEGIRLRVKDVDFA